MGNDTRNPTRDCAYLSVEFDLRQASYGLVHLALEARN